MDFLIELLCGILCCIWEAMVESERIPKWGRYILLAMPFAGITVLIVLGFIYDTEPFVRFFLVLLSIGLIGLLVYLIYHIHSSGILQNVDGILGRHSGNGEGKNVRRLVGTVDFNAVEFT